MSRYHHTDTNKGHFSPTKKKQLLPSDHGAESITAWQLVSSQDKPLGRHLRKASHKHCLTVTNNTASSHHLHHPCPPLQWSLSCWGWWTGQWAGAGFFHCSRGSLPVSWSWGFGAAQGYLECWDTAVSPHWYWPASPPPSLRPQSCPWRPQTAETPSPQTCPSFSNSAPVLSCSSLTCGCPSYCLSHGGGMEIFLG